MRPRVALVTRNLAAGGAQIHIVKLCQSVPADQVDLQLLLICPGESQIQRAAIPPWVRVQVSPLPHKHPGAPVWLGRTLRSERIDVAHSFLWLADAYTSLARLMVRHRIAVIGSERGERGDETLYRRPMRLFDRLITFRIADRFCANSRFGRDLLVRYGAPTDRVSAIPNGIEIAAIDATPPVALRQELGWPDDCVIVGCVARLERYKGVDLLLQALARSDGSQDIRGVVIGDGPERAGLEQLAGSLGIGDRVAFLGTRVPSEGYAKAFDIAVLATREDTEHCSNAILEAMACARPVIASRVAGTPELIVDGVTGLLFDREDDERLGRLIDGLAAAPRLRTDLGTAGRQRIVDHFAMTTIASRFLALWREAAADAHTGVRRMPLGQATRASGSIAE